MGRVDFKHIQSLEFEEWYAGEELVRPLLALFDDLIDARYQKMTHLVSTRDLLKLSSLAHEMKTSAGNVGLAGTHDLCLQLEKNAKFAMPNFEYQNLVERIYAIAREESIELAWYLEKNRAIAV